MGLPVLHLKSPSTLPTKFQGHWPLGSQKIFEFGLSGMVVLEEMLFEKKK